MLKKLFNKQHINDRVVYGSVIVLLLCGGALLQWINIIYIDKFYYLAFIIALGLGIAHEKLIRRQLIGEGSDYFIKGLFFTGILILISFIIMGTLYYILRLNYNFLSFLIAFIIPFIVFGVYSNFLLIPNSEYKLSYFPFEKKLPDISTLDFSESALIQFVLSKDTEDTSQTSFTSRAPVNMPLSELFFAFIYEYNKKNPATNIQFINQDRKPYSWLFFTKKGMFLQKHFLDPDLSCRGNAIAQNQNVYAVRRLRDS